MMKKKSNKHSEIFFSSFINDLNSSNDLVSETLKEANIDEKVVSDKGNEVAGRLLAQMRIKHAKEKKQTLWVRALALLNDAQFQLQSYNPKEKLFELLRNSQSNPSFTFSNLQDISNEDVIQMLSEIEILDLIEALEKEKDSN